MPSSRYSQQAGRDEMLTPKGSRVTLARLPFGNGSGRWAVLSCSTSPLLHLLDRIANFFDYLPQTVGAYPELFAPVTHFVLFVQVDAASVLRTSFCRIISHDCLHSFAMNAAPA
jgi:hypothetical protein